MRPTPLTQSAPNGGYDAVSGRSAHHKARRPGCPDGRQGLTARLGSRTPAPGSVLGGEAQPGCGEGVAERGDRLGPDMVHPGEIGLGHLGALLQGDMPGRGQRLPSWPGQAGGRAGAWRPCCPVTRRPSRRGGPASCPDDPGGMGGIRCAGGGSWRPPTRSPPPTGPRREPGSARPRLQSCAARFQFCQPRLHRTGPKAPVRDPSPAPRAGSGSQALTSGRWHSRTGQLSAGSPLLRAGPAIARWLGYR